MQRQIVNNLLYRFRLRTSIFTNKTFSSSAIVASNDNSTPFNKPPSPKGCKSNRIIQELGQTTYWTHPHLFDLPTASNDVSKQQVTPGITKGEFIQRRDNYVNFLINYQMIYFSSKLSKDEKIEFQHHMAKKQVTQSVNFQKVDHNFIAIVPSCLNTYSAPDVPHPFRQNSDFLYLTGFREPNSVLVISRTDSDKAQSTYKTALFVQENTAHSKLWSGPVTGSKLINKLTGIENAYPLQDFKNYLHGLVKETNRQISLWRYPSHYLLNQHSGPNCVVEPAEEHLSEFVSECEEASNKLIDMEKQDPLDSSSAASYYNSSRYFVQLARLKKSDAEIKIMQQACDISAEAFIQSMKISHPYINEQLLNTKFEFDCKTRGADCLAYIPVIGGGPRATTIHYIRNNQLIEPDSMVLMDAGAQYRDYCSDITRTWPIRGRFTSPQRELYEACLNVQLHCLSLCKPGVTLYEIYEAMIRKMCHEFGEIGLIEKQDIDPNRKVPMDLFKKVSKYCPHDIGHYLGMDVHDCGEVSKTMNLEAGTVITIEPGIYVPQDDESAPFKYRGVGVRIEDDVVITESGHSVLSSKCPKTIESIEEVMSVGKF